MYVSEYDLMHLQLRKDPARLQQWRKEEISKLLKEADQIKLKAQEQTKRIDELAHKAKDNQMGSAKIDPNYP